MSEDGGMKIDPDLKKGLALRFIDRHTESHSDRKLMATESEREARRRGSRHRYPWDKCIFTSMNAGQYFRLDHSLTKGSDDESGAIA